MGPECTSRRRISVDFMTGEAVGSIRDTMDQLNNLWDQVGMDESSRAKRVNAFYAHIRRLLDDIVADEENMVERIQSGIDRMIDQIQKLRNELKLPQFINERSKPGSVSLYRTLHKEVTHLENLKEDRLEGQKKLTAELLDLAIRTGESVENVYSDNEVCGDTTLVDLQEKVELANQKFQDRFETCNQYQTDMQRWLKQLGSAPDSELVNTFLQLNLEDKEQVFDETFVETFKEAHQMMNADYNDWLDQAAYDYAEAASKLLNLWECCHVPAAQRTIAREFMPSTHTMADVERIKEEVKKFEVYLSERKMVYDKLNEWKALWEEKITFENGANDKARYHNRGGELQNALKRQRFISTRLPLVQNALKQEVERYEESHPGDRILLDGLSPSEHVELIMDDYKRNKELEKLRKKHANMSQSDLSKISPKKTPKKRGAPPTFTTPSSAAKFAKKQTKFDKPPMSAFSTPTCSSTRSISASTASLHSIITPIRPFVFGPKTSSPKRADGCTSRKATARVNSRLMQGEKKMHHCP